MSRHHQCWNKMHVAIVKTPPTTSCISRLDRERILIANKTNHHPYLLFLYFSCFSHLKRTKHRKHSFVRSANYAPGWQARSPFGSVPPRDLHMRIHVRRRTKFTYSFDTWRSNRVGRGWTTLTRSIGPKKKKGLLQAAVPRFLSAGQDRTGSSKQPPPDVPPPSTRFTRLESISGGINSVLLVECAF